LKGFPKASAAATENVCKPGSSGVEALKGSCSTKRVGDAGRRREKGGRVGKRSKRQKGSCIREDEM